MKKFVIDTSVVFKFFSSSEDGREEVSLIFSLADKGEIELISPILMLYELNNCFVVNQVDCQQAERYMGAIGQLADNKILKIINPGLKSLSMANCLARTDTQGKGHVFVMMPPFMLWL